MTSALSSLCVFVLGVALLLLVCGVEPDPNSDTCIWCSLVPNCFEACWEDARQNGNGPASSECLTACLRAVERSCDPNPCENGGTCVPLGGSELRCECLDGTTGPRCETKEAVDCKIGGWSSWSQCSKECGSGVRQRMRDIIVPPMNGGRDCDDDTRQETQPCNTDPCPVDCKIGGWSSWSQCSKECGSGVRQRTRDIIVPPMNGGRDCDDDTRQETQHCNTNPCPVDCKIGGWSSWSQCSKECGSGVRQRTRDIIVPPMNGGLCGNTQETDSCPNNPPCVGLPP
eukprot:TRINITY_DN516_c0_g1_i1.p1 TRINITY_DN516_c0_g1~~TRINITY_DN516_c0_g1_i1.p1  ORF type:complete len:285 (-),score=2.20 TRINITY_DN516_c0_g1_i1:143-997(-)